MAAGNPPGGARHATRPELHPPAVLIAIAYALLSLASAFAAWQAR